jgi:chromosome segregation and condensation protein ScpB
MTTTTLPRRKLSNGQLNLLSEIADFSPLKRFRPSVYVSRRGADFAVQQVTSLEARGLVEVLHENPSRVILTNEGRKVIGLPVRSP